MGIHWDSHARVQGRIGTRIAMPGPIAGRSRTGRRNYHSGIAAEAQTERYYSQMGARVIERRLRTPEGEIDLVAEQNGILIFIEVKRTRGASSHDAPVSRSQWQRLENAALHYMMGCQVETGVQPFCRFDVALAGADGSLQIIENARSFDA